MQRQGQSRHLPQQGEGAAQGMPETVRTKGHRGPQGLWDSPLRRQGGVRSLRFSW